MIPEERYLPYDPDERNLRGLAWYDNLEARELQHRNGGGFKASLPESVKVQLNSVDDPSRLARIIALLTRMEIVQGYAADPLLIDMDDLSVGVAAKASGQGRPFRRVWLYDTGAARNTIGMPNLTDEEKAKLESIPPQAFITANGHVICQHTVEIKIPHLGVRRFHVLPHDCSPLCSVYEDIEDYGNIFYWGSTGPNIELRDGKRLQLRKGPDGTPEIPDEMQIDGIHAARAPHGDAILAPTEMPVQDPDGIVSQDSTEGTRKRANESNCRSSRLWSARVLATALANNSDAKGQSNGRASIFRAQPAVRPALTSEAKRYDSVIRDADIHISAAAESIRPGGDHHNAEAQSSSAKGHKIMERLKLMAAFMLTPG